jgi:hypothetical protein
LKKIIYFLCWLSIFVISSFSIYLLNPSIQKFLSSHYPFSYHVSELALLFLLTVAPVIASIYSVITLKIHVLYITLIFTLSYIPVTILSENQLQHYYIYSILLVFVIVFTHLKKWVIFKRL